MDILIGIIGVTSLSFITGLAVVNLWDPEFDNGFSIKNILTYVITGLVTNLLIVLFFKGIGIL